MAIKVYDKFKLSGNAQVKKSVQREIRLLGELSNTDRGYHQGTRELKFGEGHPNIMTLYDAIDSSKQLYLICENV